MTRNPKGAVADVAETLVAEADKDFAFKVNMATHLNADCVMALVAEKYAATGGGYSQATSAFLQIDGGSIARFQRGMLLDIRAASANDSWRTAGYVNDVYPTSTGPGGTANIGPGITITKDSTRDSALSGDGHFDNVVDNDEICLSTEIDSNFDSFPTWFSATTNLLNITRSAAGSYWTVPFLYDFTSGGAAVSFDFDDHLRSVAEDLAYAIDGGRKSRVLGKGVEMTGALLALTTPRIASEATSQVGDSHRFTTTMATSLDAATRREFFGSVGYRGVVWQHESLPPIVFQSDPVATSNVVRLIEPSSWFFIARNEGGMNAPERLDKDNSFWHYRDGDNNRLINRLIAGLFMSLELCCDQPKANVQIAGLKSSME